MEHNSYYHKWISYFKSETTVQTP